VIVIAASWIAVIADGSGAIAQVPAAAQQRVEFQSQADQVADRIEHNATVKSALMQALARNDAATAAGILRENGMRGVTAKSLQFDSREFQTPPVPAGGHGGVRVGTETHCRLYFRLTGWIAGIIPIIHIYWQCDTA